MVITEFDAGDPEATLPLEAHLAGMPEHDVARLGNVLVEL
jgi:hypothetical protein